NLTLFKRDVTPNAHMLAEGFVLFDNFYVDADVSADGHAFSTAAYATDFIEKTWQTYAGNRGGRYLSEGDGLFRNPFGNLSAPTPRAMVADNDLALGRLIDTISNSVYWKDSAVFVVEDDAQAGPDHVDSHRSVLLVASPFAKRGAADHSFYSTSSVLRTIELILGLAPMSQYDAAAPPLYNAFQSTPNLTPFYRYVPAVSLDEKHPP